MVLRFFPVLINAYLPVPQQQPSPVSILLSMERSILGLQRSPLILYTLGDKTEHNIQRDSWIKQR